MINIYCDESCHLENDGNDIMVLGGISCPKDQKDKIFKDIRNIKIKHGLSSWFEVKWTKVSMAKIDMYEDLIDYFFNTQALNFRGIVATQKKSLDHNKYNNGDYNEWYYKMYFNLLDPIVDAREEYNIMIDIKDTKGGPKIKKLHQVLCNNIYDFNNDVIKSIVQINSKESEILQLTDLLIGILSYFHRDLHTFDDGSETKKRLIEYISEEHNINLSRTTSRFEIKYNLFLWEPGRKKR